MPCCEKNGCGMIRYLMVCLVFFMGCLSLCPAVMAEEKRLPVKEISVAVAQDYPPSYFRDKEGRAVGWMVDIWRMWSQKTGIKVNFASVPWADALKLTGEGKVDVLGGGFYTEERATYMDYVAPLGNADGYFFFHKNIYGLETPKDLLGYRIGVIKGDFAVSYLREHLPGASLAVYDSNEEMFEALKSGALRVFVLEAPVALYFLKQWKLLSNFNYHPGKPLYSGTYWAAVKKGDTLLPPVIKEGLALITPEEMAAIERRWVGAAQTKTEGVLSIACDRYYPPFTELAPSGQAAGILIDLWRLWASKNFRKVEFVFGDWEETVQMVKDGRADFHSGLYKTRERESFLSFSDPVFAVQDCLAFKSSREPVMLAELSGYPVGVITGSGEETALREQYPKIIRVPYKGYRELIIGLRDGEVMAVYDVGVTLQHVIDDLGLQGEIRIALGTTPVRNLFVGVAKKDVFRLKSINSGLSEITEQEIRDIEARWVSNEDLRQYSGKARPMVLTFEEKQWLKEHPSIRLGVDPNFMPFEAFSSGGDYEGLSSSYVSIISRKLGVALTPVKGLNWQGVMDAVKAGDLDVLPCVAKTPERSEFLLFTRPYLDFQTVAVTRKDAPFMADLKGLKDAKVAVVKGYFLQEMLKKDFPEMRVVPADDIDQGLKLVAEGKAAAFVDISASIIYALNRLNLTDLKVAATTPYNSSFRFAIRKDWPQLATILDKALQSIPEEERATITNRWVNVRFAERTDWGFLLKIGIAIALAIGLILTIIIIWNRRMAKEVGERKRAEERFQAIAATTPGAIIQLRFDAEGRPEYLYLSPRAEVFFGIPVEQVMEGKGRLPWHPEDFERIKEEVRVNLLAEADMNHVGRIISKEGAVKWIRLNASPGRTAEGELIYNGFILDISERKLAELEYVRSERKIKAMSQAAEDALVMVDGQGKVLFWNPAAERLFGYTEAEAMGMDFHQIAAPEEYHDKIYKGLEQFAKTGEGAVLGTTTEITARNRNGELFPAEVTLSSFKVDEEWFAVGTVRDISERKKAEKAIKESERRMADLIDFLPDPIIVIDVEGKVLYWNRAMEKLTGVKKENMLGQGDYAYATPFYGERRPILVDLVTRWDKELEKQYLNIKKEDDCLISESFHPHMGDRGAYLSGVATVLYDAGRTAVGAIESLRNITSRKLAEEAMRRSERRLNTILETANEGFQLINNDLEILDQNPTMCQIMGREKDDVIGKTILDFVDEENKKVFLKQIELRKQGITNAYEIALSRPDGSHAICIYNATPLLDENNEKIGAFAMVANITERKQAEEKASVFFNATNDGLLLLSPEKGFVHANAAAVEMLGFETTADLLLCGPTDISPEFQPDGRTSDEAGKEHITAAMESGSAYRFDWMHKRCDGSPLPCEVTLIPIMLAGEPQLIAAIRDIIERKKAENELKERMEELERFSRLTINREGKMIQLKEEINTLLERTGGEKKYKIVE